MDLKRAEPYEVENVLQVTLGLLERLEEMLGVDLNYSKQIVKMVISADYGNDVDVKEVIRLIEAKRHNRKQEQTDAVSKPVRKYVNPDPHDKRRLH